MPWNKLRHVANASGATAVVTIELHAVDELLSQAGVEWILPRDVVEPLTPVR